jgi:hypothetical protein
MSLRAGAAGVSAAAVALLAGCGGDDDGGPDQVRPARFGDLLARLPHTEDEAIALDVAGARRELGLPAGAAPPTPPAHGTDGARRLRALTAATVLNYPIKDNGPLDRALDYRQVTAFVRVDGPPEVVLIATRQPWDDLRRRFERGGWHERGDRGVLERPPGRALRWVAGRDGLVVAAGDPRLARAVLDGRERTAPPLRALLDAAGGPARAARLVDDDRCITGVAAGYSPAAAAGHFTIAVRDVPPRPFALRPPGVRDLPEGYSLQRPRAAGGRVQAPFTYEASTDPTAQPTSLAISSRSYFAYRC